MHSSDKDERGDRQGPPFEPEMLHGYSVYNRLQQQRRYYEPRYRWAVCLRTGVCARLLEYFLRRKKTPKRLPVLLLTTLLVLTLFRLGLNVSTTRSILGTGEAGGVVETFGHFVIGGNPLVGFVVFIILIIIQFLVITKGAERVSEVAKAQS